MTTPDATPEYHSGDRVKFRTECGKGIVVGINRVTNHAWLEMVDDMNLSSEFEVINLLNGKYSFKFTCEKTGKNYITSKHVVVSKYGNEGVVSYLSCKSRSGKDYKIIIEQQTILM